MPALDWRIIPARSISRCDTICASLGFSRSSGRKYSERRIVAHLGNRPAHSREGAEGWPSSDRGSGGAGERQTHSAARQFRNVVGDDSRGAGVDALGKEAGAVGRFKVALDRVGPGATRLFDKACRRLDAPGSANRDKNFALREQLVDLVQAQ